MVADAVSSRGADAAVRLELLLHADRFGNPPQIPGLLCAEGAQGGAFVAAGSGERSHTLVYERGDEPVQGRVSWTGEARLQQGDDFAEVRARRGQAQRSGERGVHQPAPYIL